MRAVRLSYSTAQTLDFPRKFSGIKPIKLPVPTAGSRTDPPGEAETFRGSPHRLDDGLRGVVRRGHRIARRLEFGGCQKCFKLGDTGFPALRDAFAFSSASDTEGFF